MSQTTSIEWTDVSWNPVHGCSKVSPGCAHCYAETLSRRYKQTPAPWTPANAAENVILKPHKLREPLKWKTPRMVFVNSMSDLFHELVPDDYIRRVWDVMACCSYPETGPVHTFQVLTKRPERMREWVTAETARRQAYADKFDRLPHSSSGIAGIAKSDSPAAEDARSHVVLPNVWLGVSIENRRFVHRADVLRATPAAVRFISAEPLLGPLIPDGIVPHDDAGIPVVGWQTWKDDWDGNDGLDLTGIDWVIVGGESGPGHRPLDLEWARDLIEACRLVGAAPFVKQLGGARPGTKLEDLPEDLRIREFPAVRA